MKTYIDTSLLVTYYCPESGSKAAESYLLNQKSLSISLLTKVEFSSALRKKALSKELGSEDAGMILDALGKDISEGYFKLLPVVLKDYREARQILSDYNNKAGLHTLDAIHLAIAKRENLILATADKQLAKAAELVDLQADYIKF
ncbi:MAG: type II toxin-antitoxin system VapC family toxin [Candidatus Dadabacteria bacterium]|nr:type II toxin-antitoxin system VapC family toxin [Candidatus Dadabacteria bacterium]NIS08894.1 type II toxin-antitoxin system VapC family toxin [Candidatus Dadabacteria bacterium]NIV42594.1 PIN domain-containing protein [Candidatus Dadabacteria bacterium]NIY22238.1 PIN domain-containing protein [Candidatus Dadabacteria bacterium]